MPRAFAGSLSVTRIALAVLALAGAAFLGGHLRSERRLAAAVDAQTAGREADAMRLAHDAEGPTTRDRARRVAAVAALRLGDLATAEERMAKAVAAAPRDWFLRYEHAVLLRRAGRRDAARREMQAALALAPRVPLPAGFTR